MITCEDVERPAVVSRNDVRIIHVDVGVKIYLAGDVTKALRLRPPAPASFTGFPRLLPPVNITTGLLELRCIASPWILKSPKLDSPPRAVAPMVFVVEFFSLLLKQIY
jgi:hypothetical protein